MALATVATIVNPFGSTTGKLVVHCQDQLLAYAGNHWDIGGVMGAGHPHTKPVARSHDSATEPGSVEFDLPPGIYTVTTDVDPSPCEALAWVAAGETTTAENHTEAGGLSNGGPQASEVAATPAPTRVPTPTPTPWPAVDVQAARTAFLAAYSTLTTAERTGITDQDSENAATSVAGIDAQIAAQQAFDAALEDINPLTHSNAVDLGQVYRADWQYEDSEGSLAANRGNIQGYNEALAIVTPLRAAVKAALYKFAADLNVSLAP